MSTDPVDESSPAIDVREIHRLPEADALKFADETLGPPESWPSPLITYRLGADVQADWKVEVGQWLWTAKQCGFLDRVLHDLRTQAQRPSRTDRIDPNDERHLKMHQHLAVARVTHYLTALGWAFEGFEPETGGEVDVDLSLWNPGGGIVELQVKAPDQPGRVLNGQIVDGEHDRRIVHAVKKAAGQLRRPATGPAMIAVCANRERPLSWSMRLLVKPLLGSTIQVGTKVFLTSENVGWFFKDDWSHVSGVVVLDFVRGVEVAKYICAVLLNPTAAFPASADWFPRARVARLSNGQFHWVRGAPRHTTLPDGTMLVDEIPDDAWSELHAQADMEHTEQ